MTPEFDGYEQLTLIGRGTHTDVYRTRRTSTGAAVAIKVYHAGMDADTVARRVRREIDALVALRGHPNVISVEEVVEKKGHIGLAMEFASDGSLADRIRNGPLSADHAAGIAKQVATALRAAHDLGVVHRDVKPENILFGAFQQVKLCDFGLAATADAIPAQTSAISVRYSSPEELDGLAVTSASDVFSFGAVLFHCLTGRAPRLSERASPEAAPELAAVPAQLTALIAWCMQPDPTQRPTMVDVVHNLAQDVGTAPAAAPITSTPAAPAAPVASPTPPARPTSHHGVGASGPAAPTPPAAATASAWWEAGGAATSAGGMAPPPQPHKDTIAISRSRGPSAEPPIEPPLPSPLQHSAAGTGPRPVVAAPLLPSNPLVAPSTPHTAAPPSTRRRNAASETVAIQFDRPKPTAKKEEAARKFPWVLVLVAVGSGALAFAIVYLLSQ